MWNKILDVNRVKRYGPETAREREQQLTAGPNSATVKQMNRVNTVVRRFLRVVEAPLFAATILAILVVGELNLFSAQVQYQTEPIASIGVCSPN